MSAKLGGLYPGGQPPGTHGKISGQQQQLQIHRRLVPALQPRGQGMARGLNLSFLHLHNRSLRSSIAAQRGTARSTHASIPPASSPAARRRLPRAQLPPGGATARPRSRSSLRRSPRDRQPRAPAPLPRHASPRLRPAGEALRGSAMPRREKEEG